MACGTRSKYPTPIPSSHRCSTRCPCSSSPITPPSPKAPTSTNRATSRSQSRSSRRLQLFETFPSLAQDFFASLATLHTNAGVLAVEEVRRGGQYVQRRKRNVVLGFALERIEIEF